MNSCIGKGGSIWSNWLGSGVKGVSKQGEIYNAAPVVVFTEENTWTIKDYSNYPFNDTHFTVGNRARQIDNFATFHNAPGDRNRGGANVVMVGGHVELVRRRADLDDGFRLCWPKKELPF